VFVFDNVLTAGTVLVREAIESQNFDPANPTAAGWGLLANGDAYFNNITAQGNIQASSLDIQQPSGGRIASAFTTDAGVPVAEIDWYSRNANEAAPARIWNRTNATQAALYVQSPKHTTNGNAQSELTLTSSRPGLTGSLAVVEADEIDLQGTGGGNASVFVTGSASVSGALTTPSQAAGAALQVAAATTTATAYATVAPECALSMPYPASGVILVAISADHTNDTATQFTITGFEIRDTNSAGTLRVGANDARAVMFRQNAADINGRAAAGYTTAIGGLPTSGTMFVRLMCRVTGGTGNIRARNLSVIPLLG
jgi:hypothetical protein